MKVLINTSILLKPLSGVGKYTYNLAKQFLRLRPDISYTFYRGYFTRRLLPPKTLRNLFPRNLCYPLANTIRKIMLHFSQLSETFDLYFEPTSVPLNIKARRIVSTVHDFSVFHYPDWHPRERVEFFKKHFEKRILMADVIVTPSKYIQQEAVSLLNDRKVIVSIPNGYDPDVFFPKPDSEEKNVILFVGTLEPRKNLGNLLNAFDSLPEYLRKEYRLVICGPYGWRCEELLGLLKKKRDSSIQYLGYVQEEDLAELYRSSKCLVYPSFYEGFGLPVLEAMASGCPVIASNKSALPEVCGDAALYVDPYDVESIRNAMVKVIEDSDLRATLRKRGLERAKNYTWERSAEKYLEIFESLL